MEYRIVGKFQHDDIEKSAIKKKVIHAVVLACMVLGRERPYQSMLLVYMLTCPYIVTDNYVVK